MARIAQDIPYTALAFGGIGRLSRSQFNAFSPLTMLPIPLQVLRAFSIPLEF